MYLITLDLSYHNVTVSVPSGRWFQISPSVTVMSLRDVRRSLVFQGDCQYPQTRAWSGDLAAHTVGARRCVLRGQARFLKHVMKLQTSILAAVCTGCSQSSDTYSDDEGIPWKRSHVLTRKNTLLPGNLKTDIRKGLETSTKNTKSGLIRK